MAEWFPVQQSFLLGEMGDRFSMNNAAQKNGVEQMINYMPTKQGTAERVPGTRYIRELLDPALVDRNIRIFGFTDNLNRQCLLEVTDGQMRVFTDDAVTAAAFTQAAPSVRTPFDIGNIRRNVVQNYSFIQGAANWTVSDPPAQGNPPAGGGSSAQNYRDLIPTFVTNSAASYWQVWGRTVKTNLTTANWTEALTAVCGQSVVIPPPGTEVLTIRCKATWETTVALAVSGTTGTQIPANNMGYRIYVSNLAGFTWYSSWRYAPATAGPQINADIQANCDLAAVFNRPLGGPFVSFEGALLVGIEVTVPARLATESWVSHDAYLRVDNVLVLADAAPTGAVDVPLVLSPPDQAIPAFAHYTDAELNALHFVQSPYPDRKEVVITHPNHPPARLYFDPARSVEPGFVIETIPFVLDNPNSPPAQSTYWMPPEWVTNSYPASCSAYQGRLVLGGGGFNSEDVILSVSGDWANLFDLSGTTTEEASNFAIKFTATFRSALQWVAGAKALLLGAQSLEYLAESPTGTPFRTGNIDVRLQTSQGSAPVQPVDMGDELIFASERGRKIRSLQYQREHLGFVAKDFTINSPFIVQNGVRRLLRLRNPHQMVICLLTNGQLSICHYEPTIDMLGWSRVITNGRVLDVTVVIDANGLDVPVFAIERTVNGTKRVYLEVMPSWIAGEQWAWLDCWMVYDNSAQTNVFTGLEHLEGRTVDVVGDGSYVGPYVVQNGQITLMDGEGQPIVPTLVVVGLPKWAVIVLFPPVVDEQATGGPGAVKRYSSISVRLRNSYAPVINGHRPPDKASDGYMDYSDPPPAMQDVDITKLGSSIYEKIIISETLPFRSEIVGVYGKLTSNRL